MKIRIYQINDERDTFLVKFRNYENLEYVKSKAKTYNIFYEKDGMLQSISINSFSVDFAKRYFEGIYPDIQNYDVKEVKGEEYKLVTDIPIVDSAVYDKVYDAELNCNGLDDVYMKFNIDHPENFRGHSLSVSDVIEVYESDEIEKGFYFCDSVGFKKIDFDPVLCQKSELFGQGSEKIAVIFLEPDKLAKIVEVENNYKAICNLIDGYMETISLDDPGVLLICDDEGKIKGSPLNRSIKYDDKIVEIIAGKCFICGTKYGDFCNMSPEMTEKYMNKFKYPELFFRTGKGIKAIPYNPEANKNYIKADKTSMEDKLDAAKKEAENNKLNEHKYEKGKEDLTR